MIRHCSECAGCTLIETVQGRQIHICTDEEGGAFLKEVGLCGFCGEEDDEEKDAFPQKDSEVFLYENPNEVLYGGKPGCNHRIVACLSGGVRCTRCNGWFCF